MLNIDWQGSGWAAAKEDLQSRKSIIDDIAGRDRRPLLIHVQRKVSDPRVDQYLKAALKSERFQLASQWFQCYQLNDEVSKEGHPYANLLGGKNPPQLLLVSRDGRKVVGFLGTRSSTVKWTSIAKVLSYEYRENPTRTVKDIERLLSAFDALDAKAKDLDKRIAAAEKSKDATKLRGLKPRRAAVDKEREALFTKKKKLESLRLRRPGKPAKAG